MDDATTVWDMTTLSANPVLLLAIILGVGYLLGGLRLGGVRLGVSAVFFAGLAASAIDPRLRLPDFVDQFGLVLFVYMVGLSGGPMFFKALRKRGLLDNAFVVSVLLAGAGLVVGASKLLELSGATAAGVFAGASVNVPALAGALQALRLNDPANADARGADAVVAMSLTYPVGVIAMVLAILVFLRFVKPDFAAEAAANSDLVPAPEVLIERTVQVTHGAGADVAELSASTDTEPVLLCRVMRGQRTRVAGTVDELVLGDRISLVGTAAAVEALGAKLGPTIGVPLSQDRRDVDFRRITVSSPKLAGVTIASLNLLAAHGALITRVRRGDADLLASGRMTLNLGDRVRVVAPHAKLDELAELFGDSDVALGQIDIRSLTVGVAAGLLLGLVPLPLPGGAVVRLGLAGGPILAGLALGFIGQSGPFTWQLPRNVNSVLRQQGVGLFFAGIGSKSGHAFIAQVTHGDSLPIVALGATLSFATALVALLAGYYLLKVPVSLLMGMMAGLGTNPAVLTLGEEKAGNDLPAVGYATVFPVAMIMKIIIGELLVQLLS